MHVGNMRLRVLEDMLIPACSLCASVCAHTGVAVCDVSAVAMPDALAMLVSVRTAAAIAATLVLVAMLVGAAALDVVEMRAATTLIGVRGVVAPTGAMAVTVIEAVRSVAAMMVRVEFVLVSAIVVAVGRCG